MLWAYPGLDEIHVLPHIIQFDCRQFGGFAPGVSYRLFNMRVEILQIGTNPGIN